MAILKNDAAFVSARALASVNDTEPFLAGQVGAVVEMEGSKGLVATGKLPGVYQYVQRATADTGTLGVGVPVAWADAAGGFVVGCYNTVCVGTQTDYVAAGVALGTYPAAGKYGFIQVAGVGVVGVNGAATVTGAQLVPDTSMTQSIRAKARSGTATIAALEPQVIARQIGVTTLTQTGTVSALLLFPRLGW